GGAGEGRSGAQNGILCASGYVAGEGLAGVLVAGYAFAMNLGRAEAPPATAVESLLALGVLGLAAAVLFRAARAGPGGRG
ncbi:MAG: hypothetical protein ACREIU_01955, partial [Planctomycetota bacterium]